MYHICIYLSSSEVHCPLIILSLAMLESFVIFTFQSMSWWYSLIPHSYTLEREKGNGDLEEEASYGCIMAFCEKSNMCLPLWWPYKASILLLFGSNVTWWWWWMLTKPPREDPSPKEGVGIPYIGVVIELEGPFIIKEGLWDTNPSILLLFGAKVTGWWWWTLTKPLKEDPSPKAGVGIPYIGVVMGLKGPFIAKGGLWVGPFMMGSWKWWKVLLGWNMAGSGGDSGTWIEFWDGNIAWVCGIKQEFLGKRLERYCGLWKLEPKSMLKSLQQLCEIWIKERAKEWNCCKWCGEEGVLIVISYSGPRKWQTEWEQMSKIALEL